MVQSTLLEVHSIAPMHGKESSFQCQKVCFQQRHPYTGSLNSELSGDSENTFLHCGDISGGAQHAYAVKYRIELDTQIQVTSSKHANVVEVFSLCYEKCLHSACSACGLARCAVHGHMVSHNAQCTQKQN